MTYKITANERFTINIAPATLIEEIIQNVAMILSTPKGTAPLFRDFGADISFLDRPIRAAESLIVAEVYDAIEMFEPRAEILSVSFEREEMTGRLIPIVEVGINGE